MLTSEKNQTSASQSFSLKDWQGGYRSQPQEFAYWIEDIEGQIPADLEGTLFRNGPGLLDVGGYPVKHPFDGDGLINSIAFKQGRAFFRSRYIRTEGYVAEQKQGKPVFRGVFGTQKPGGVLANAFDLKLKNIANTHVVYWGGKLLALWEAAEPHRLDPQTLETIGLDDLEDQIAPGGAFTAHPKFDPGHHSGQPRMVGFSVKSGVSSTITLYEFDLDGKPLSSHSHTVPGFAFLHDFAITPNYAIFFQNPVTLNPLPYVLGFKGAAECIAFNEKAPTKIVVIPRNGEGPVQFIDTDPCFVFHHANAFEVDGRIVVDSIRYSDFPSLKGGENYLNVDFDQVPEGQLWRFTVDLAAGTADPTPLVSRSVEFPTLNPERVGLSHRYLFIGATHSPTGNAPLQAILKLDLETQQEQIWSAAPRGFIGEPVFVPQPQGQSEDAGWILILVYNAERTCSDLVILDAQNLEADPVARLKLNHHIPYGLHGSFVETYFGPA
ncbi:carotenoid oxygenase family protein [Pseudanabaena sp. FACHB-2040]|uniref:carotenoid oxygenase family protein n=1 Tax=Pseudanabaena sp. FACHB-2040 TaxID=2692859 RepID=UPI00168997AC|nr:carotenoid oxygenase family protein [Pseudanabaena sp. FACHB-2040]MBD2258201.1 carotenoid oxygenase family protein [Pseudanabaena sp. FACHB-2040]